VSDEASRKAIADRLKQIKAPASLIDKRAGAMTKSCG